MDGCGPEKQLEAPASVTNPLLHGFQANRLTRDP
jgi:hypothetical protein